MTISRSLRAPLATALAVLLALFSSLIALPGAQAADGPTVTVSPDTGLSADEAITLTIRGSGFTGAGAANGAYVSFGARSLWQPGSVPPSGGWIVTGWVQPRQISEGSFETTLTVPAGTADHQGSYGVATFAAHQLSATDRTLDTWTPVAFAAPEPEPTPTAEPTPSVEPTPAPEPTPTVEPTSDPEPTTEAPTPTAEPTREPTGSPSGSSASLVVSPGGLDPAGGDLVVTGSGFYGSDIYVQAGWIKPGSWRPSQGGVSGVDRSYAAAAVVGSVSYATARFDGSGGFTVTLPGLTLAAVEAKRLAGAQLAVFTVATGGAPRAADETSASFAFAAAPSPSPTPTPTPTPTTDPTRPAVSVTPATGIDPAAATTLTVTGSRFTGPGAANGLYLSVGTSSTWQPGQVPPAQGWVVSSWVQPQAIVGGAFSAQVTIPAEALIAGQDYGVATFAAHGLAATNRTMDTWTPVALKQGLQPVTVTTTRQSVSATSLTVGQELTVTSTVTPAEARGTLTLLVDDRPVATSTSGRIDHRVAGLAEGTHQVRTTFASADPATWANSTSPSSAVSVSAPALAPSQPTTDGASAPGELLWGVRGSFRSYVTGPIAQGTIAVSGGAGALGDGRFRFPQASSEGSSSATYRGTVTFTGHHGDLAMAIGAPAVRIVSGSRGDLIATVGGSRITLATLDLAAGTRSTVNGALRWSGVPTRLTGAGAAAFDGFYGAGELMDPVTFTIGSRAAASADRPAAVVARPASTSTGTTEIPDEPPSTSGLTVTWSGDELVSGASVTLSGSGFEPGETGIRVVLYSDPIVLADDVTADDEGTASWTGRLPANLTGQHTLTLQGSTQVGRVVTIGERAVAQECAVTGATLQWGVKESFRSYISGSIAHGDWSTSGDVTYATPEFTWTDGAGDLDGAAGSGLVQFDGDVRFTGHDGALDTTLADPALEVSGERVYLLLDVRGETRSGDAVSSEAIRFAEVDADSATVQDGAWSLDGASATLTEQGAAAFGTYSAGDALDPVTATIPVQDGCATAGSADSDARAEAGSPQQAQPQAAAPAPVTAEATAAGTGWVPVVALVAGLVAAAGVAFAVWRGRRA